MSNYVSTDQQAVAIQVLDLMQLLQEIPSGGLRRVSPCTAMQYLGQAVLCRSHVSMPFSPDDLAIQFFRDNYRHEHFHSTQINDIYVMLKARLRDIFPNYNPYRTQGIQLKQISCTPRGYLIIRLPEAKLKELGR